jgi:hypothetical protein
VTTTNNNRLGARRADSHEARGAAISAAAGLSS